LPTRCIRLQVNQQEGAFNKIEYRKYDGVHRCEVTRRQTPVRCALNSCIRKSQASTQQNTQVHLHIKVWSPVPPGTENQAADGPGLVFEGGAADPQAVAPLSLKPQEKARLDLTFPARLRLGPQTPAGGLEFQCDFDVAYEATP